MKPDELRKGVIARYVGAEHSFMTGHKVRLNSPILDDDDRPTGRWDVSPWIEKDQRFSWVASDARIEDLAPWTEGDAN